MEKQLEAEFILKKRYCAVSIAKTSDLESKFNVKAASDLSDMLHCPMRMHEKVLNLLYNEIFNGKQSMRRTVPGT